jgi:hypothetical protein
MVGGDGQHACLSFPTSCCLARPRFWFEVSASPSLTLPGRLTLAYVVAVQSLENLRASFGWPRQLTIARHFLSADHVRALAPGASFVLGSQTTDQGGLHCEELPTINDLHMNVRHAHGRQRSPGGSRREEAASEAARSPRVARLCATRRWHVVVTSGCQTERSKRRPGVTCTAHGAMAHFTKGSAPAGRRAGFGTGASGHAEQTRAPRASRGTRCSS